MIDKRLLIQRGLLLFLLIFTAVLQNTSGLFFEPFGARALLLIPAAVCTGMFDRTLTGALLCAFSGALWDMASAHDGFNAVFLFFAAFFSGLLISRLMRNNVLTALVLSVAFTAVYIVLYILFFFVFAGVSHSGALLGFYVPSFVYTVAVSPLQYLIIKSVCSTANRPRGISIEK